LPDLLEFVNQTGSMVKISGKGRIIDGSVSLSNGGTVL